MCQPDVHIPGVDAVEEQGPDLQLGPGIVYCLHLVWPSQINAEMGKGFPRDIRLLLGQVTRLLLQGLLVVRDTEPAVPHEPVGQGPSTER